MYKPLSVEGILLVIWKHQWQESPTHSCYLSVSGCIAADFNKGLNNKLFLIFYLTQVWFCCFKVRAKQAVSFVHPEKTEIRTLSKQKSKFKSFGKKGKYLIFCVYSKTWSLCFGKLQNHIHQRMLLQAMIKSCSCEAHTLH